jgi:hypothetical protein
VFEEQARRASQLETIIITNDTNTRREPIEVGEQGVEHTQQQAQKGITTTLLGNLILEVSAKAEIHTKSYI